MDDGSARATRIRGGGECGEACDSRATGCWRCLARLLSHVPGARYRRALRSGLGLDLGGRQHGELGYADVLGAVRACDLVKRPALVRVPAHEASSISLALDTGAAGVIIPCVDTPQEARAVVDAAKFPPLGKRSYGGRRPIDLYGRSYADAANTEILLVCQIESRSPWRMPRRSRR